MHLHEAGADQAAEFGCLGRSLIFGAKDQITQNDLGSLSAKITFNDLQK